MRILILSLPIAILGLQMAWAGFRHPIEQTGEQAAAVQNTVIQRPAYSASTKSSAAPVTAPNNPADRRTAGLVSATTAPRNFGPVPKAPGLPDAQEMKTGGVNLPKGNGITVFRDSLPTIEFKGKDRSQRIHSYSRQARMLPLPKEDHAAQVRSRAIVEKYRSALSPVRHMPIRTPLNLHIDSLAKITLPSKPAAFRHMVKRIDALFDGLEGSHARGVVALWELSRSRLNPPELRARDSLFSGILSLRAQWESVAANQFETSAAQDIQEQERYLKILWSQLDHFENPLNVDRVVNHFSLEAIKELAPQGDKANFSLAKKSLREKDGESAAQFSAQITSGTLHDRFDLLKAISSLQPREKASAETRASLEKLATQGDVSVRDEARLALARALLREGATQDSLVQYKAIQKNGVNRLEVMSEQSYVEFLTGNHPEALGKAIGVESKFFQYGFSPDIHLVETLSRKANCDFGGAEAALQRFADRYAPEFGALDALLREKKDPAAYYEELIAYHEQKTATMRHQRYLLRLPVVMENQKLLNQAERDLHKIEMLGIERRIPGRPEGWDAFAQSMRAGWQKRIPAIKQESGAAALAEASYMATRLRQNFGQAELMGLDLSTSAAKDFNLQNALNFPVRKLAATEPKKDQVLWPFEQEIWEDELDSLRMKNPSKCALANKPTL